MKLWSLSTVVVSEYSQQYPLLWWLEQKLSCKRMYVGTVWGMEVVISKHAKPTALRWLVIAVLPTEWFSSLPRSKSISWVLPVRMLSVHGEFEMRREEAIFQPSPCSDQARHCNCSRGGEIVQRAWGLSEPGLQVTMLPLSKPDTDLNVIITCACDIFAQE